MQHPNTVYGKNAFTPLTEGLVTDSNSKHLLNGKQDQSSGDKSSPKLTEDIVISDIFFFSVLSFLIRSYPCFQDGSEV